MKFKHFYFQIHWDWLVLIPTIIISINEQMYYDKNSSIQFHWLGFHLKWFWIGKENKK